MEIERNEEKKIISVWLTKAESRDENLQRRLKAMYPKWKKDKYLVAVYHSGKAGAPEGNRRCPSGR